MVGSASFAYIRKELRDRVFGRFGILQIRPNAATFNEAVDDSRTGLGIEQRILTNMQLPL